MDFPIDIAPKRSPKLGDVVIYTRNPALDPSCNGAQEFAAKVTRVWSDECVNLKVHPDSMDADWHRTSVVQGAPTIPGTWRFQDA